MDIKVMVVGSAKSDSNRRRPRIRLAGFWLENIGFEVDTLVTADYDNGSIVLKSQGTGIDTYTRLVRQVRKKHSSLLQVTLESHNRKQTPHLEVKGFWLEKLSFTIGSVIVIRFEYGLIHIKLLDLEKLGF